MSGDGGSAFACARRMHYLLRVAAATDLTMQSLFACVPMTRDAASTSN